MCSAPKMPLFSLTWLFFSALMTFQSISCVTEGASQTLGKVEARAVFARWPQD